MKNKESKLVDESTGANFRGIRRRMMVNGDKKVFPFRDYVGCFTQTDSKSVKVGTGESYSLSSDAPRLSQGEKIGIYTTEDLGDTFAGRAVIGIEIYGKYETIGLEYVSPKYSAQWKFEDINTS